MSEPTLINQRVGHPQVHVVKDVVKVFTVRLEVGKLGRKTIIVAVMLAAMAIARVWTVQAAMEKVRLPRQTQDTHSPRTAS
jgi:hypothetical protein